MKSIETVPVIITDTICENMARWRNPFKRKPSGYQLFVEDISRLDGKDYYSLNENDMRLADYMLDKGYMYYTLRKGKPILHISDLGNDMIREEW